MDQVDTTDAPRVDQVPGIATNEGGIGAPLWSLVVTVGPRSKFQPSSGETSAHSPALGMDTVQHQEGMIGSRCGADAAG